MSTSSSSDLAERVVDTFMRLVHRGSRLAVGVLIIVSVICVGSFALGLAALSDGVRTAWAILGGVGVIVAIGALVLVLFRLWVISTMTVALIQDMRTLLTNDPGTERVVIETVEASDGVQDQSAVVMSRQFFQMNATVAPRAGQLLALSLALKSITAFPLLMMLSVAITFGFACLSVLFALGLLF
jgi:hypothetical protein